MKVNLSRDQLDTWLYNRDNGDNAAEKIIEELRKQNNQSSSPTTASE